MNKPPGHYRDEKGYEYYWDGQHRSYIPDNSFRQFREGMERATPIFLWGYLGIISLPIIGLLVLIVGVAIWEVLQSPVALLIVFAVVGIIFFVIVHDQRVVEEERIKAAEERAKVQAQRERERRKESEARTKESEARAEANNKRVEEIDKEISALVSEGIRGDFIGKVRSDYLPTQDYPMDKVFAGMTEAEQRRHIRYINLNSELKRLRPKRFQQT